MTSIESNFLTNVRQLTFEGLRAGEGYFNSDGTLMVFQSERRGDNPFFQIYLLNLQTGDVEPISPGHGKTTCSWIHPDNNRVLFSSTHEDPEARAKQKSEIEFRESGQTRRYAWDYDPKFELFAFDRREQKYHQLTHAEGYDAEGSYSPDGTLIAFASNRRGYSEELSPEVRKTFEKDPSYLMDIYLMNADGSDVRQLTDSPGYDGGPFFSPDGKRICWRRFSEDGMTAEIFTMNIDGSDQQQLTRLGNMSWAPYYHPSSKYLIFNTNTHGFNNFELYLVAADGKSLPVRVTDTEGFDGLASFSPDGKKLTWTSGRTAKKDSQIFLADWNHEYALRALMQSGVHPASSSEAGSVDPAVPSTTQAPFTSTLDEAAAERARENAQASTAAFSADDFQRHLTYLSTPGVFREESGTTTKAAAYLASYFEALGLSPAGDQSSWFQAVPVPSHAELSSTCRLTERFVGEEIGELGLRNDWYPLMFGQTDEIANTAAVFAGLGIVAPAALAEGNQEPYDSYENLNVVGRWVVALGSLPSDVSSERKRHLAFYGELDKRAFYAQQRGAQGLILVDDELAAGGESSRRVDFNNRAVTIPVIAVSQAVFEGWLSTSARELKLLQSELQTGEREAGFELADLTLSLQLESKTHSIPSQTIVARLSAGESPAATTLVISASLGQENAAAIASLLEMAEFLATQQRDGKVQLKRDIVFAVWAGSSAGHQGAKQFVNSLDNRSAAAATTAATTESSGGHQFVIGILGVGEFSLNGKPVSQADLNGALIYMGKNHPHFEIFVDCADTSYQSQFEVLKATAAQHGVTQLTLRARDQSGSSSRAIGLIHLESIDGSATRWFLHGTSSSPYWAGAIEARNVVVGLPVSIFGDLNFPTDATPFQSAEIPVLSAFTDHQAGLPIDAGSEPASVQGAVSLAQLLGLVARGLATNTEEIPFVAPESKIGMRSRTGARASLGTMPDYSADVIGVKLSDVRAGTPAQRAGLKANDVIVGLAGKEIETVQEYSDALNELVVGQAIEIVVERDGQRITLKITPAARQ